MLHCRPSRAFPNPHLVFTHVLHTECEDHFQIILKKEKTHKRCNNHAIQWWQGKLESDCASLHAGWWTQIVNMVLQLHHTHWTSQWAKSDCREHKMQIFLRLEGNSHSPQLRGAAVNENILTLLLRSSLPVLKHHYSVCEVSIMSCIMKQGTKQLVGPALSESGREGVEYHCLSLGRYFSCLSPFALYSVQLSPLWEIQIYEHGKDIMETRQHICIFS